MNRFQLRTIGPGLGLLVGLSLLAAAATPYLPIESALLVVIVFGVAIANTVGVPDWATDGVETYGRWLEAAIVLMGASLAVEQVLEVGGAILVLVCVTVTASILTVEAIARLTSAVPEKTASLLAAGSGICGVSAVAAVAGAISPDEDQIAYAAATVLAFDAITLAVYPAVGRLLELPDSTFGIWAGATMFSTGPATAAGFAYSQTAGEWAVLVKLARNALIGIVAIAYALQYSRRDPTTSAPQPLSALVETFPRFVLAFVVVVALASFGVFTESQVSLLSTASVWFFLVAFAGLGLSIDVETLRKTGFEPAAVVTANLILVSTLTLLALLTVF